MPKDTKGSGSRVKPHAGPTDPYSQVPGHASRSATIWTSTDDEILLQARASGLNWQPLANKHFPNKTANACRKRHERLIERRNVDDWDTRKLDLLAREYMACRREMWEILAARLGERWGVVEAKCMEKGLKTLQTAARTGNRRAAAADSRSADDEQGGIPDHHSDSGIGLGSEAEIEVEDEGRSHEEAPSPLPSPTRSYQDHIRSRSLPQPLPLYQPPPPISRDIRAAPHSAPLRRDVYRPSSRSRRDSPESHGGRGGGISIESVLSK